jgi:heme-degrading monooxygenase HmoA
MIARIWNGSATVRNAPAYEAHLRDQTLPRLSSIAGHRGAYVLSQESGADLVRFTVITLWESLDAIRRFAGDDAEAAVVPAEAKALLASFDVRASHWNVVNVVT